MNKPEEQLKINSREIKELEDLIQEITNSLPITREEAEEKIEKAQKMKMKIR